MLSGKYSQRIRRSQTTVTIGLSGKYQGYTFPTDSKLVIVAKHKRPLNLSNPFKVASCTATVPSHYSFNNETIFAQCDCEPCGDDKIGIKFNCGRIIISDSTGFLVFYPDTSSRCFSLN